MIEVIRFIFILFQIFQIASTNNAVKESVNENKDNNMPPIKQKKGFSLRKLGIKKSADSNLELTNQLFVPGGKYYLGSQMDRIKSQVTTNSKQKVNDGAEPRVPVKIRSFVMDADLVSNAQFRTFVKETKYVTEAEQFGWSFVLENVASPATIATCDARLGRVKDASHWLAVEGADWRHPEGPDSSIIKDRLQFPVSHISYTDASEYCAWAGLRLPSESEWEAAARGGHVNASYPWGNKFESNRMNIWEGKFPENNLLTDGYLGTAPLDAYPPQTVSGFRHLLGNVWEWVQGGTEEKRILRGGSFVDSQRGDFNHIVTVSTRQINAGNSAANNVGFRCASRASSDYKEANIKPKNKNSKDSSQKISKVEEEDDDGDDRIEL